MALSVSTNRTLSIFIQARQCANKDQADEMTALPDASGI